MIVFIILASVVVFLVLLGTLLKVVLTKAGALGPSKEQRAHDEQLRATGGKARAWITGIRPTGVRVNTVNVRCDVSFRLEPLSGAATIDVTTRMNLAETAMPALGTTWPAWYDLSNPSDFLVQPLTSLAPDQMALRRQFGIDAPTIPPPS